MSLENSSSRPIVVTGNWKMYKTIQEATQFVENLAPLITKSQARVLLAVPFTAIHATVKKVESLQAPIVIGAQNMNDASEGAFTGEIAARMLKEAGARFVILGHSERRQLFHETNDFINKKVKRALEEGIQPTLCIGETLEERQRGVTEEALKKQLEECLADIDESKRQSLMLAYEPVWAIGTGNVSCVEDAQAVHQLCRNWIAEKWGKEIADALVIQYGGSVNPENAANLLQQPDIDGLLVGGASLSPESFAQIIHAYQKVNP